MLRGIRSGVGRYQQRGGWRNPGGLRRVRLDDPVNDPPNAIAAKEVGWPFAMSVHYLF